MMKPRIAVVSLWAEDVPTTVHFYHDVLGFSLLLHHHERPHFNVGNGYLTILKGRPVPAHNAEPSHFPLVAFVVENFEATIERLQDHAVEFPWGIEQGADSQWVKFYDPAGNLIELVRFKHHGTSWS